MKNGDFSGLVDASGRPDPHLRPGDRPRRQRRLDARSVPGQQHPGRTASTRRRGRSCSTTRTRTTRPPASRRGRTNLDWAEHFNKDLFWNWVGKVDHNFSANDRAFFRWGENERQRDRQSRQRHPQRPGPGRPAAALARQPRARRRLGAHLRRRDGLQPARQLHLLPGVELFPGRARLRCDGVLAREPRQPDAQPGDRRHLPAHRTSTSSRPCRAARARTGTGTTRFSRTCR